MTRIRAGLAAAAAIMLMLGGAGLAAAQSAPTVKLFKIITLRDTVEIGVGDAELRSFGPGTDIENLARRLVEAGQLTVWQYAVRKAASGELEHAPLKQVAIFKTETLRIEMFNPAPLKIAPLK